MIRSKTLHQFQLWAFWWAATGRNEPLARICSNWCVPWIWKICKLLSAGVPSKRGSLNIIFGSAYPNFVDATEQVYCLCCEKKAKWLHPRTCARRQNAVCVRGKWTDDVFIYIKTFNPIPTIKSTNFNNFAFDLSQLCIMSLKNSIYNFCAYFSLAECRRIVSVVGCARTHVR